MNLTRSFPHDTPAQIKEKSKAFYWHLSTVFIEAVKNLSFSADALKTRIAYTNPSLIHELHARGKNILLVGGHYGNWEWLITSLGIHFPSNVFGLGMPLSASFWQQKLTERRERFGLKVIHSKNYREHILKETNQPFILLMLADQSPGDSAKSYWMQFLNQPTAIPFGTEALANETDAAVVFLNLSITSPGFYSLTFELLNETPKTLTFGELTEDYTKRLESAIHSNPSLWMWSHKRWKREIPEDLNALRTLQENRFNQRYR
jgi:KDO2-lipid IV(A) lauroyltransferase